MGRQNNKSPQVLSSGWGRMEVEDIGTGKDFKLWPGGGREWDWAENGTGHGRGIQIGDVEELVEKGAQVIILTQGVLSRLKVPDATRRYAEDNCREVIVTSTKKGIKKYNEYAANGEAVAGLFHSTC